MMQIYDIPIDRDKKEVTRHGSRDFPLAVYATRIRRNILGFIDWHWHEELQFCVITKGDVLFHVDSDSVLLTEGNGLFINKGHLHKAENYRDADSSYICLDFHPDLISGYPESVVNERYIWPYINSTAVPYCVLDRNVDWQQDVLKKLAEIHMLYGDRKTGFELSILISLLTVWQALVLHRFAFRSSNDPTVDSIRLKRIIGYIGDHYMEKMKLKDIADEGGLSKSVCCREFKKHMKCTVFEYIINYRLVASANLLLTTEHSITDIAYRCGFGSTSYFIEKFKKKSGTSPYVYRKSRREKEQLP